MKFRFYDPFNDCFSYSRDFKELSLFFSEYEKTQKGGNDPVLEQSKECIDKAAKTIYTGDIVFETGYGSKIFLVAEGDNLAVNGNYSDGKVSFDYNIEYKIIGNIHQNKDLLGAKPANIGYWLNKTTPQGEKP